MIDSVSFKNFRGLNDLTVSLSQVTMLTGTNGVGKTSVLEGLYCLFSETRLDVSPLSRYNKSLGLTPDLGTGAPAGFTRQNYNYRLFWEECPLFEQSACSADAGGDDGLRWSWRYQKANLSDLGARLTGSSPLPVDSSTEFALWNWRVRGELTDRETGLPRAVDECFERAQILTGDGGLYLLPPETKIASICKYLDFASMRIQPRRLSFQTSKLLTKALQIIDPRVTDVRLTDIGSGLSAVLDDKKTVTLGTIGNGVVTWASALIAIFEVIEAERDRPRPGIPIILLVDEIGAGIHYSVMLDLWRYIGEFAAQNRGIQFVFTTHSDDCIRAFCEAFSDRDSARIVRLHRTAQGGKVVPTDYEPDAFGGIIDGDWEVRG